jgi:hypothetical protein
MGGFAPFGAAAFGDAGESSVAYDADLLATLVGVDVPRADDIREAISQALNLSDFEPLWFDLPNLLEGLAFNGSILSSKQTFPDASDTVDFSDALQAAWAMLLESGVDVSDPVVADRFLLGAIIDTMVATGAAVSVLDAVAALTAAIAMETLVSQGWSASITSSMDFADALAQAAQLYGPLVDSAAVADTSEHAVRLLAVVSEAIAVDADPSALAQMAAEGSDGILLYGTFRLAGDDYAGWVLNTVNKAPSQYTNFQFESLAFFAGKSLGAGTGGIFEHTGDDDEGTAIDAFIKTGLMDLGTGKLKNVPDVWVGFKGDGRLVLKVTTTNATGTKVEDWYVSNPDTRGGELREGRFELGRGIESRYWQWELHNKAGEDFELSEIALRPVILSRRR